MQLRQRRCVSLSRSADAVYGTAALRGCALALVLAAGFLAAVSDGALARGLQTTTTDTATTTTAPAPDPSQTTTTDTASTTTAPAPDPEPYDGSSTRSRAAAVTPSERPRTSTASARTSGANRLAGEDAGRLTGSAVHADSDTTRARIAHLRPSEESSGPPRKAKVGRSRAVCAALEGEAKQPGAGAQAHPVSVAPSPRNRRSARRAAGPGQRAQ